MKLILASSSPRRAEILRNAEIEFEICAAELDETLLPGETASAMVARLAEAKARAIAESIGAGTGQCIVIGADTTVELNGEIFGKPRDSEQAREMLGKLSGNTHRVLTGIFLQRLPDQATRAAVEVSEVTFARTFRKRNRRLRGQRRAARQSGRLRDSRNRRPLHIQNRRMLFQCRWTAVGTVA